MRCRSKISLALVKYSREHAKDLRLMYSASELIARAPFIQNSGLTRTGNITAGSSCIFKDGQAW